MNPPGIRRPRWFEKLDWITDDGRGVVGYRWFYYPVMKLYRAIRYAITLEDPDNEKADTRNTD